MIRIGKDQRVNSGEALGVGEFFQMAIVMSLQIHHPVKTMRRERRKLIVADVTKKETKIYN